MKVWLYYRLSRDEDDELNSLTNQRKIIYEYAVTNGHEVVGESFDDNVSGMHFNREGIDKIYEVVEAGKIEAIIVKDLSRLGRNSALTGLYTNFTFPQYGVRYIAINDNFDTIDPNSTDNDFRVSKTGATSFMREIPAAKSALSIRQRVNAAFL